MTQSSMFYNLKTVSVGVSRANVEKEARPPITLRDYAEFSLGYLTKTLERDF